MDCSVLIGQQLEAMRELAQPLSACDAATVDLTSWRELRDRAAAHVQVRDQLVLPALQRRGWQGLHSEALRAHIEFKLALAALCICPPGRADFQRALIDFAHALEQQRLADALWIVPALRRSSTAEERRLLCSEIERLHEAMVPPPAHYLAATSLTSSPGAALVEDAALVLRSLGEAADPPP